MEKLEKITTQWTQMEYLADSEGPAALADFLAIKYFSALALKLQEKVKLDELKAHELASEVIYELIKNDYRGIKKLNRDKGHLRGLLATIVQRVVIDKIHRKKNPKLNFEQEIEKEIQSDKWLDMYLDFQESIEKLKQERPLLYEPFIYFYLKGHKVNDVANLLGLKPTAIKQRLHSARKWLSEVLSVYNETKKKNR